jgi:glycosyltransferase involved in cell wall biosynthesis
MRICFFSIVNYYQGVQGGMEIHGKLLTEGLVKHGHHVTVLSTRHPEGKTFEKKEGVEYYYLNNTVFGSSRNRWRQESADKFVQMHIDNPFDVVLSQSFAAFSLMSEIKKYNINIDVIPILQGCIRQRLGSALNHLYKASGHPIQVLRSFASLCYWYFIVERPLLSASKRVITASNELVDDLRRWHGVAIANKAVPVFNGIDTEWFRPDKELKTGLRSKYDIKDNEILLLTLGTINREKGHHLAVEALSHLRRTNPNLRLMIVGTGEYQPQIKKMVWKAGLKNDVIFPGSAQNHETVSYYNGADIFLMPTLRVEGLPFVLLEAMSCGLPIIASRIGGNTSLVKDGKNGFLVEPGNVEEISKKVLMLAEQRRVFKEISSSARETILQEFSVDTMVDGTIGLIQTLIS